MSKNEIIKNIISSFHEYGMSAKYEGNENAVFSSISGLKFAAIVLPDQNSVTFLTSINIKTTEKLIRKCNEFNSSLRFCRCYTEDDKIICQIDFFVVKSSKFSKEILSYYIPIWETFLGRIVTHISENAESDATNIP